MAEQLSFDAKRTAVLSMDNQAGIVASYAKDQEALIARGASVLERARSLGMCVIHIQVGFRPGLPEVSSRNMLFGAIKSSARHQKLFEGELAAIHPGLGPEKDDIVVTKHRVSAFHGTDLEVILRAKEIDTLVLFGIATSGVVLSTLLEASDADYRLVVIKDCCVDGDAELHANLIDKVFARRASVVTASEFLASAS
ncbi:MAG: isochorismatase family cysteine hydrolase [Candidatus Acidiferrum sp.]